MSAMAFQITGESIVYSTVCSGTVQRKYQRFSSLAFVREIHRWPMDSPHKGPVTLKMFPCDDVIMNEVKFKGMDKIDWCQTKTKCSKHEANAFFSWWRHQMETFSALLAICAGNSTVPGEFPHKGQWRGALLFSLICVWINGWVNDRQVGDLRRYRTHYDVIVMLCYAALAFAANEWTYNHGKCEEDVRFWEKQ